MLHRLVRTDCKVRPSGCDVWMGGGVEMGDGLVLYVRDGRREVLGGQVAIRGGGSSR